MLCGEIRTKRRSGAGPSFTQRDRRLTKAAKPPISAEVALALLEGIRSVDRPSDRIDDEVVSRTMPRRLGVSTVIERQIRLHQGYVKEGRRQTLDEFAEFLRLVNKRPDASEVFFQMGTHLADSAGTAGGIPLPRRLRLFRVRRSVLRAFSKLFGRRLGGFVSGPFALEVSASPFVQLDDSGTACQVLTGFCQRALDRGVGDDLVVVKSNCEARGDRCCRWTLDE